MFIHNFFLLILCFFTTVLADISKLPKSITLSYEIIGAGSSSAQPLAIIAYDPRSLKYNLESWTPPSLDSLKSTTREPTTSKLLRILLPNGSSTVTSLDAFNPALNQNIDLLLSPFEEGTIYSASISSSTPPALTAEEEREQKKIDRAIAKGKPLPARPTPKTKKAKQELEEKEKAREAKRPGVKINVIPATPAPTPKLNSRKPPQVDAEGREIPSQEEEPEKSFFQKYWWIFLVALLLTMTAGPKE